MRRPFEPGANHLEGSFFQPWLVPRKTYLAIARLVPREYVQKMRAYFDDYGCIRCDERTGLYGGNGMCSRCRSVIWKRLFLCWRRRVKVLNQQTNRHVMKDIVTNAQIAHRLLKDLVPSRNSTNLKAGPTNPATDLITLAARTGHAQHQKRARNGRRLPATGQRNAHLPAAR